MLQLTSRSMLRLLGRLSQFRSRKVSLACFDRTAIEEIAENLISNAIKYGDGKPIDVMLARDAGEIRLQVRDHGLGISANDQTRIFEQFERLVTGRPTSGFGLGLWVVGSLSRQWAAR